MFKRLKRALQLKPAPFQPASSVAMVEAHESKETKENQKVQQQNENSSGSAASKEPKYEKHVSFSNDVQVKIRTPSPISPVSPSCNLESGFNFPKPPDEQSPPIPSSSILARYYAAAENASTSLETQHNPKSGIFKGKPLEQRMKMLYKSSLASQGIFTEHDSTDDQVESSDQCCGHEGDSAELSVDFAGACGGYDYDGDTN